MEEKTTSIKKIARIGGILYLLIIGTGVFGELFVRNKLIVSADPTATANNIIASPLIWRIGILGDLVMHILDVPLMVVFYILLRPVNRSFVLVAVLFASVQTAVLVATKLNLLQASFFLDQADYLKAFQPEQLRVLTYLAIKSDGYGFAVGLIFFGFACLVLGYLIFKSGYLPKLIGVLIQVAGICYITNSTALILAPKFANFLAPGILLPPFVAETSFCLWLIVKGVNVGKWREKANVLRSAGAEPAIP